MSNTNILYVVKYSFIILCLFLFACKNNQNSNKTASTKPPLEASSVSNDISENLDNEKLENKLDTGDDMPDQAMGGTVIDEKEARNKYLAEDSPKAIIDKVKEQVAEEGKDLKKIEEELPIEDIESFPDE